MGLGSPAIQGGTGMIIQHNMAAMYASRQTIKSKDRLAKKAEKLSSGYRINRSADDAAGLQISEKMRGQIRGLEKASKNAQDGISLLQTADGALNESHSLVQRIRELAVQAANDTNVDADREAIQEEIDQLIKEVDNIAENTEFNTLKLLDGSLEGTTTSSPIMQIFTAEVSGGLENVVVNPVVVGPINGISSEATTKLSSTLANSIVPQAVNKFMSTFSAFNTADTKGWVSDGIGLKIYQDTSNTLAYVSMGYAYYDDGTIADDYIKLNLSVNVNTLQFDANGDLTADSRRALETTIVHEMMHAFMDDTLTNGMIGATGGVLDASNEFPSWFTEGMAQAAAGGCSNDNDWVNGGLGLTENSTVADITAVVQASANSLESGSTSSQYGTGYLACMYLGYLAAGKPSSITNSSIAGGINTILSEMMNGKTLNEIINEKSGGTYTSVDDFESKFGDAESAQFIQNLLVAVGSTGNGGVVSALTDNDLLDDANTTSNAYTVDEANEYVTSSVGSGRNWQSGGTNSATAGGGTGGGNTGAPSGTGGVGGGPTVVGPLHLQIGANSGQAMGVAIDDMHAAAIGLSNVSVNNHINAGLAISACDEAIEKISANRSKIGAYTNRLEHAISNLDNTAENLQAAESRIRDTDMAELMVEYSKENILIQAGQAMLTQANQSTQGILQLLQ